MATRLYRSIVVFGTTLGAGGAVVAVAPLIASGCSLDLDDGGDDSWHGIIDAAQPCRDAECPDAWYVPIFDAPWAIIDAPMPDAAPPDAGNPDAAVDHLADPTDPTDPDPTAGGTP